MIESEGRCGDALAGFYLQWLQPDTAPDPPPHAWAWRACRLWQTEAAAADWAGLEHEIPERRMEIWFLRLLAPSDPKQFEQESHRWLQRYPGNDGNNSTPAGRFMHRQLPALLEQKVDERRETALAVLASGAVGTPEFAA